MMIWHRSHRAEPAARAVADRHYNRQSIGAQDFMPPGRCCVFYLEAERGPAVWGTSWPFAEYVRHAWGGAWMCSIFRNESGLLSSELIRAAVAATRAHYGEPPELGMVTFVDAGQVRAGNPGYCYLKAGFRRVGYTKAGLHALQLAVADMPPAEAALPALGELQFA